MNKNFKKALFLIIAVVMIAIMVPFAFAAEGTGTADGVPMTINVENYYTGEIEVGIGSLIDPDGYVLTGTNTNISVRFKESCAVTLDNVTVNAFRIDQADIYTINIMLKGDNKAVNFQYGRSSFIINAQPDATLTLEGTSGCISTVGFDGDFIVNGGTIIAKTTADVNYSTVSVDDFIINGGTVTLYNNFYYPCSVINLWLNGGVLNLVSTADYIEALCANTVIKNGAILTLEAEYGLVYGALNRFNMADDADDNDRIFVRYDKTSDFTVLKDLTKFNNSSKYAEIKVADHEHIFNSAGDCVCGDRCEHEELTDYICNVCGVYVYMFTHQPTLEEPYVTVNDDAATYQWCNVTGFNTEIDDTNAEIFDCSTIGSVPESYLGLGEYNEEDGWTPSAISSGGAYMMYYFTVELKANEKVSIEFSAVPQIAIMGNLNSDPQQLVVAGKKATFTAPADGEYVLAAMGTEIAKVKANFADRATYAAIVGETSDTLSNTEKGQIYVCEVTLSNGSKLISEAIDLSNKITHQPTMLEPYVTTNDEEAVYQWYTNGTGVYDITDENAVGFSASMLGIPGTPSFKGSVEYTDGVWTPTYIVDEDAGNASLYYFVYELKAGEILNLEFSDVPDHITLGDLSTMNVINVESNGNKASFTAEEDIRVVVLAKGQPTLTVKASVDGITFNPIEGATEAEFENCVIGNRYYCEVTYADGEKVKTNIFKAVYLITHQPTVEEFYIETNDENAKYQWCNTEPTFSEITDQNAEAYSYNGETATYDAENGWTSVLDSDEYYSSVTIDLKEGDVIKLEFAENGFGYLGLWDWEGNSEGGFAYEEDGVLVYEVTAEEDGCYTIYLDENVPFKLYMELDENSIEGATSATYEITEPGEYFCKVTFSDSTVEKSDIVKYTAIPAVEDKSYNISFDDSSDGPVYMFIPEVTGVYAATSDKGENIMADPYVSIYDIDGHEIAANDDADFNNNFYCAFFAQAGKSYYIDLEEYGNDNSYSFKIVKHYEITHEPTAEEPYVEMNWDEEYKYQWNSAVTTESEVTDLNARGRTADSEETAYYVEGYGWKGIKYDGLVDVNFFEIDLNAGDVVKLTINEDVSEFGIWSYMHNSEYWHDVAAGEVKTIMAEGNATYYVFAVCTPDAYVNATVLYNEFDPIEGATSASFHATETGLYNCDVTLKNGTVVSSGVIEVETVVHDMQFVKGTPATCRKDGIIDYYKCSMCDYISSDEAGLTPITSITDVAKGHIYEKITTKATQEADGIINNVCKNCGYVGSKYTVISKIDTMNLSTKEYTYNKTERKPKATIKDSTGKKLVEGTDYTVTYENGRILPGKYTVKITFKGNYEGTKKLYYTIKPRVTSKISATQTITTLTLNWRTVTGADGYRIYMYNPETAEFEYFRTSTDTTLKIKELTAGTVYKFKVRAYHEDSSKIYGEFSPEFETATMTKTPLITEIYTSKVGKAVVKWSDVDGESGFQLYYSATEDGEYEKVKSYVPDKLAGAKTELTSGQTYFFKVRAYTKTASGVVFSKWSPAKSVTVK